MTEPTLTLRFSPTSPFARKVRAAIIERDIADRIAEAPTDPWAPDTDLADVNPLGQVPALVMADGTCLMESTAICDYLDTVGDRPPLIPAGGNERWRALRRQALADGIMEAAALRRLDAMRPAAQQSADWQQRKRRAIMRTCALLDTEADQLSGAPTIGHLAIACALGYLDLRFADDPWRPQCPDLAHWYETFRQRSSLARTAPP